MATGVGSLDVEAMVGVWWVLIPLQKGPLKLNTQCGCGVGRKMQEELQHVGPLTVPASHIVLVKEDWGKQAQSKTTRCHLQHTNYHLNGLEVLQGIHRTQCTTLV